jgi:hypothetical protein
MNLEQAARRLQRRWEGQRVRLRTLPEALPPGRVLVHSSGRPQRQLGMHHFHAWLQASDAAGLVPCRCPWAGHLAPHFRLRRPGDQ